MQNMKKTEFWRHAAVQ